MLRPRFFKLPSEKRERLLSAAARAFGELGYERATVKLVLTEANISTGAAYYYFDTKADLFTAALTHFVDQLVASPPPQLEATDAESFWKSFALLVTKSIREASEAHRTVAALRIAWKRSPELAQLPEIAEQFARNEAILRRFFRRGRELGAIRVDLPDTLLVRCGIAIDETFDAWLTEEAKNRLRPFRGEELVPLVRSLVSMLRAMFSPPNESQKGALDDSRPGDETAAPASRSSGGKAAKTGDGRTGRRYRGGGTPS
jgi:AcrR family transcriptional regulator